MSKQWTVRILNRLLGTAHFCGTFDSEKAARDFAQTHSTCQAYVSAEVWTGTPRRYGDPTDFIVHGGGK